MRFSTENVNCHKCGLLIGRGEAVQYARRGPLAGKRFHPACYPKNADLHEDTGFNPASSEREENETEFKPMDVVPSDFQFESRTAVVEPKTETKPITGNPLSDAIVNAIWPSIATLVTDAKSTASSGNTATLELAQEYTDSSSKLTREIADLKLNEAKLDLMEVLTAKLAEFKPVVAESTKIEFSIPGLPAITVSTPHPQLPKLIKALQLGMIPYLYGQAGSGKTHAAINAAEILNYLPEETYVVTCNPFSSPIELIGYTDAHGKQVDKAFIRAFRDGGFIILDEADRSRPDFLPALNSALANKQLVSPDGTIVRQHERFTLVLTGNTPMHGQSKAYNSAARQDASVIDRLFYIEWIIDEKLEMNLGLSIDATAKKMIQWAQAVRKVASPKSGTQAEINVTMRGVLAMVKVSAYSEGLFTRDEILNATILKGISEETRDRLINEAKKSTQDFAF